MEKYQFIYDYAPRMWLNEDPENPWFPSTLDFFLRNVQPENLNGEVNTFTVEPITSEDPYVIYDFFHGQEPVDGLGSPVQTLVFPYEPQTDPMQIMLDPLNNKIHVFYIYFFPYDHVKKIYHLGNHVGDIEQTNIVFENGVPVEITADYHSWYTTLPWGDPQIEMYGNHPVVYNARGTHSTWFSAGIQRYAVALYDVTA